MQSGIQISRFSPETEALLTTEIQDMLTEVSDNHFKRQSTSQNVPLTDFPTRHLAKTEAKPEDSSAVQEEELLTFQEAEYSVVQIEATKQVLSKPTKSVAWNVATAGRWLIVVCWHAVIQYEMTLDGTMYTNGATEIPSHGIG